jgi:5-formyltetrahydrofolate cyclo-ligase
MSMKSRSDRQQLTETYRGTRRRLQRLEFAILRELGHPPVPVATTMQVVDSVPRDPTDQPPSMIATPTHAIRIKRPSAAPTGIDWTRLSAEDLEEMPILAELKRMTTSNA